MVTLWWKPILVAIASLGGLHGLIKMNERKIDRFFMGVFRDLGRHKARRRRHQTSTGLVAILLKQDDPMEDLASIEEEDLSNLPTYTSAELEEFGDGYDGRPILISIFGRVYDVSKGAKYYGPEGGTYGSFAGQDVTYALSTGCRTEECVYDKTVDDLSEKDMDEGKRWLSFFHLHDKYPLVGQMEGDHLEILMSQLVESSITDEEGELKAPLRMG
mmetsp:Transcript_31003/g.45996  ORF Transcript_31003/g.45996 Transcript_31003/m.45996 type:complete len:216 (-) Transcript_31003:223-870(-)|eukprot:CAMPEP_0194047384 /NCGR_PEP_ID=MMETSP0009_2-20130614/24390_1 /TAXON_ID=210454 /ORGANISM="Grammatophora oceanica, Strain CCMP 410" /LENGTH=215 /DNA_ID=CAMNT_0038692989 /DNA_START=103 /DNA_END=750 /DNA_ORIENTATION=+